MITPKTHSFFFIHGWGGSKESNTLFVSELSKRGFVCDAFDLPGHGKSEIRRSTLSREDFFNFVIKRFDTFVGENRKEVILVGTSFGAYLGILLPELRKVDTLALRVPAHYPDEGWNEPQEKQSGLNESVISWRNKKLHHGETRALRALHTFSGNIIIVESEFDELVPHQTILNYINAITDKNKLIHLVLSGAHHQLKTTEEKEKFFELIMSELLHKK